MKRGSFGGTLAPRQCKGATAMLPYAGRNRCVGGERKGIRNANDAMRSVSPPREQTAARPRAESGRTWLEMACGVTGANLVPRRAAGGMWGCLVSIHNFTTEARMDGAEWR